MTKMVTGLAVWASESKQSVQFTPDVVQLEQRGCQLMFFYDELQYGLPRHELIEQHLLTRNAAFTTDHYVLHKLSVGDNRSAVAIRDEKDFKHPDPWLKQKPGTPALIKGELCSIISTHLQELDSYYQNTVECNRERVSVQVPYREVKWTKEEGTITTGEFIKTLQAWMYVGIPKFWEQHLDGGYTSSPVRLFEPNRKDLENYYHFSRLELDDG